MNTHTKFEKSYTLYANEKYFDIVSSCAKSIRTFSKLPILVYLLDSDKKVDVENVITIKWTTELSADSSMYSSSSGNFYINRSNENIYRLLIQRPMIVKDALEKYTKVTAYIDSDSIATRYCDRIFDMYDSSLDYPYFVEGIYDYLHINGRGGADSFDDLSTTLEHNACELFGVNQYVRNRYRQTGYFVAGQNTIEFLDEWYWMCTNPKILKNFEFYAPYHEETIANVLLWKYSKLDGLPYIYMNGDDKSLTKLFNEKLFTGNPRNISPWFKIPSTEEELLFVHGEKRIPVREEMIKILTSRLQEVKKYPNIDPSKNWGDVISQFLLDHFSGKKLKKEDIFYFDDNANMLHKNGKIVGVGSTMKFVKSNDYVWGTGCIDEHSIGDKPKKVYSVRGPLTRNILLNSGWDVPEIYGDPALLFPKIYNPTITKKYKYGLIPHYIDYKSSDDLKIINHLDDLGIKIINITSEVYNFIDQLLECEFILSSSLHGLIVADAYGIPNYRVKISSSIIGGDFKYLDHYASVKRTHHTPLQLSNTTTQEEIDSLLFEVGDISEVNKLLENSPWSDPECPYIQSTPTNKVKVLFLAPHLSTGGMPSFLLKRIESLLEYAKDFELYVVEYSNHSSHFVVQKNRIKELIPPSRFWTLGENKMDLIKIIEENNFDIIHLDEMIESFDFHNPMSPELMNYLYKNDRTWRMVETCHNIIFKPNLEKHFHPESYAYCTPWHKENTFKQMPSYGEVIEFPIENKIPSLSEKMDAKSKLGFDINKKHVVNVGLWTQGKNQKEGVELARLIEKTNPEYQFHFVGNQAPNFQEYWQPIMKDLPSNVKVWGERNDVDLFLMAADIFMFNSTWECNPLVLREAISHGLPTLSRNLPQYMDMFTNYIYPIDGDVYLTKEILLSIDTIHNTIHDTIHDTDQVKLFAKKHSNLYNKIMSEDIKQQKMMNLEIQVFQHFVNNPFLEIKGNNDKLYKVEFFDEEGVNHYTNEIKPNHWVKLNRSYYTKWRTKISHNNQTIYDETLNFENKRVYISFDSKSLGDTVAWAPYLLEFKKKHKCHVVASTYWNQFFKETYPEIEFVEPGTVVNNINGMYKIGWFYNENMEPQQPNTIPLQKAATNILGLEFKEIKPNINYESGQSPYNQKYITIATNSTAGCKFWTREGWQELINYLHSQGYLVINVSKEDNPFKNAFKINDTSIENTMRVIHHSEFFIGLSSGLSWLAWGIGKHVVMISNFTEPDHEFTTNCTRIINKSVCNGCWNNPNFKFDRGDWNWCPVKKGTPEQFICHTSITSEMVIEQIQQLLM